MSKPAGIFWAPPGQPMARPAWARFSALGDWDDFAAAARDSEATGIRWVLWLMPPHDAPIERYMADVSARIDAAGVRSWLVGVVYFEEWYTTFKGGFMPLPGIDHANPAHWRRAVELIHWWTGKQIAAIKAALPGVAVVWIENYVNDDPSLGDGWYQPVPAGVDVLALEGYVPAGGSWARNVEPFLRHAVATRREPIALVVQGFRGAPSDPLWGLGPTADTAEGTRRWMAHPRVRAAWVFEWASREPGWTGLEDLPQRAAMEHAMGVA